MINYSFIVLLCCWHTDLFGLYPINTKVYMLEWNSYHLFLFFILHSSNSLVGQSKIRKRLPTILNFSAVSSIFNPVHPLRPTCCFYSTPLCWFFLGLNILWYAWNFCRILHCTMYTVRKEISINFWTVNFNIPSYIS